MARSLGRPSGITTLLQDDPGVRGGVLGVSRQGGEQVGERHRRSQHLQPAGPGPSSSGVSAEGAAEKRGMTPKNCDRLRAGAGDLCGLMKRRSGRSVPAASPC